MQTVPCLRLLQVKTRGSPYTLDSSFFIFVFISVATLFLYNLHILNKWAFIQGAGCAGGREGTVIPDECWSCICEQSLFTKGSWSSCFVSDLMKVSVSFKLLGDLVYGKVTCCLISMHPQDYSVLHNHSL